MELNTANLPNEILHEIFGYLQLNDIINFTSVDKRLSELRPFDYISWKNGMAKCNYVIKKLNYTIDPDICTSSRRAPNNQLYINSLSNFVIYKYDRKFSPYGRVIDISRYLPCLTISNWSGKKMIFGCDKNLWSKEEWETGAAYERYSYEHVAYIGFKIHVVEDEDHYSINITNY